jgi:hypothetical protein
MSLIFRLVKITASNGHSIDMTEVRWTASPTSVGPYTCWIGLLAHNCQVDCLQTNAYDCGVWVLASIAAVLHGFDVTGFSEADIPWFRQFLMYHILLLPVLS